MVHAEAHSYCQFALGTWNDVHLVCLTQVGFEDLKAATDRRYYKFRSQQLLHLDDPNMCVPVFSMLTYIAHPPTISTPE